MGGLVAVVIAALVVGVAMLYRDARDARTVADNTTALRSEAGRIVSDVFTVHRERWRSDRERARTLVAPGFIERYGAQLDRPPADGTESVVWRVEAVAPVRVGVADGRVLLATAVTSRTTAGAQTTVRRSVLAGFARTDGRWLLDHADVIG